MAAAIYHNCPGTARQLEAELRVAFALEGRALDDDMLSSVRWIIPNRRLMLKWWRYWELRSCRPSGCGI